MGPIPTELDAGGPAPKIRPPGRATPHGSRILFFERTRISGELTTRAGVSRVLGRLCAGRKVLHINVFGCCAG
jgi:hypothetical protein